MQAASESTTCPVCSNPVGGNHYGIACCRSCASFFKRCVSKGDRFKRHPDNDCGKKTCNLKANRKGCKQCRFKRCLEAGMKPSHVQQRREPTGIRTTQKRPVADSETPIHKKMDNRSTSEENENSLQQFSKALMQLQTDHINRSANRKVSVDSGSDISESDNSQKIAVQETEILEISKTNRTVIDTQVRMTEAKEERFFYSQMKELLSIKCGQFPVCPFCKNGICEDGLPDFKRLIRAFSNSVRYMQLSFSNGDKYIREINQGPEFREMKAEDLRKMSKIELSGVLFWTEKIGHVSLISEADMAMIIKRYTLRKIALDHFYSASKYPEKVRERIFVLNNYTFVPPENPGFSLNGSKHKKFARIKFLVFSSKEFWTNVIDRFIEMNIGDAEIVFLHHLLIWSPLIRRYVSRETQRLARARRSWAVQMIFDYYNQNDFVEPEIRIAQLIQLFQEIEIRIEQTSKNRGDTDVYI